MKKDDTDALPRSFWRGVLWVTVLSTLLFAGLLFLSTASRAAHNFEDEVEVGDTVVLAVICRDFQASATIFNNMAKGAPVPSPSAAEAKLMEQTCLILPPGVYFKVHAVIAEALVDADPRVEGDTTSHLYLIEVAPRNLVRVWATVWQINLIQKGQDNGRLGRSN